MFIKILLYALSMFVLYHYALKKAQTLDFNLQLIRDFKNSKKFFTHLMKINSRNYKEASALPHYKYFKELILTLIEAKRTFGAPIDKALNEIKKSLGKDIHFEKRMMSSFLGGAYQMMIISFVGFLFIVMSSFQLNVKFPIFVFFTSLGINILGFFVYGSLLFFLKKRCFDFFEALIKNCYMLRAYLRCQMPIVKALSKVNIDGLKVRQSELYIKERIEDIIRRVKIQGGVDFAEFDMQVDEIWLLMEFKFEAFQKQLSALKLAIIVLFFLSTYLYIIYSFIETINI